MEEICHATGEEAVSKRSVWTEIDELTSYTKVPKGIVLSREVMSESESGGGISVTTALCFVPCSEVEIAAWASSFDE